MALVTQYSIFLIYFSCIANSATVTADLANDAMENRMAFFERQLKMQSIKLQQQEKRIIELEQKQLVLETELRTKTETVAYYKKTDDNATVDDAETDLFQSNSMGKHEEHRRLEGFRGIRQTERVAFTVYATQVIQNLGQGQPIKFDSILTNTGNNYNVHTGVFTVPRDGLYAFCFYIAEYHVHEFYASLVVDGQRTVQGIADGMNDGHDVQGGNFALINLSAGQSVWLESDVSDGYIWASNTNRFESFSGFYLY